MNLGHDESAFEAIGDVKISDSFFNRFKTDIDDLDAIFGDGILPGSTMTIVARPGVGKTTLCLTLAELLTNQGLDVGYTSGEEDKEQIAYNAKRLRIQNVKVANMTDADELIKCLSVMDVIIIDSFQCVNVKEKMSKTKKIDYVIENLVKKAKKNACTLIFIVQINSDGSLKGGTTLPHAVDVNITMSKLPDFCILIDVEKNRFGATLPHQARMLEDGMVFEGLYDPDGGSVATESKPPKLPTAEKRKDTLLDIITHSVTMDEVIEQLDVGKQTAGNMLRDLVNDNKLVKVGRGLAACWHKPAATKQDKVNAYLDRIENIQKLLKK